ncbi:MULTISPECIES: hypothetical protein [unclassified Moritella]|uniref:hypothetical protein n=1 Tax=unclassified Moritella TaxID=2637987 RepID=UPI001BAC1F28|nr:MULTISPECIES: hypothetical protein [unclassified Moritella]QUM85561.1 hypothetical protein HWV02_14100 [Moritella sp. 28]QUM89777.1 hypothetical protein HWV03_13665 [Moritella sp. 36]
MIKTVIPRLALIASALLLSACSTQLRTVRLGEPVAPKAISGKFFFISQSTANVGDVILTEGEYLKDASDLQFEMFRVKKSTTTSVEHKMSTFKFSIPAGDYLLRSKTLEGSYYSAPAPFTGLEGTPAGYGGLFVPNETSEATELYWHWTPNRSKVYQAKLTSPIINGQEVSAPRATLTYVGVAADQIRFAYKEFSKKGMATPAFTQEVILDYKPGGTYTYKGAQFIVEKADSTHINFTILRPL